MLNLLKGRFDLHDDCQFVEKVPKGLELAVDVGVLGCFADVIEALNLAMGLLQLLPLFAFPVNFPFLLQRLRIGLFRWHKYN